MDRHKFTFGRGAIVDPSEQEQFDSCANNLLRDTRPANFMEKLVAEQLLHAQWELHRVNTLAPHATAATEEALLAAASRAQRNWLRATRELTALQTARASHTLCATTVDRENPPLADLTRVPKRRAASSAAAEANAERVYAAFEAETMDLRAAAEGDDDFTFGEAA